MKWKRSRGVSNSKSSKSRNQSNGSDGYFDPNMNDDYENDEDFSDDDDEIDDDCEDDGDITNPDSFNDNQLKQEIK